MTSVLSYSLALSNAAFMGPMRASIGAVKGLTETASKAGNVITGLASLPGLIQSLVEPLTKPITLSADLEGLETSFKSLLKSAPLAKSFVKDMMQFADATPFDPVPVAATAKQLIAFGFAAKSVKPLLTDIGDLAAGMEKPLDEVGDAFGRLKAGQFGEAFERFRSFGISMKDMLGAGLKFDKSGSFKGSAEQAIEAVRKIIRQKFGGGMADLAVTFKGLFSTFQGYWDGLQRSFGKPIMQALKPILEDGTEQLQKWAPLAEAFGKQVGTALIVLRELIQSGNIGEVLQLGLSVAGRELVNQVNAGFQGALTGLFSGLAEAGGIFQTVMSDPSVWAALRGYLLSIGDDLRAMLLNSAATILDALPSWMRSDSKSADNLRDAAVNASGAADIKRTIAGRELAGVDVPAIVQQIGEAFKNIGGAAAAGYNGAKPVFDTRTDTDALRSMLSPLIQKADAFFAKENGAAEPAKQTAAKTEAILRYLDQNGITVIRNLQLIADRLGNGGAAGTFA